MDVVTGYEVVKYDVFKDLLVIFLASVAVVSTVIYGILSKAIMSKANSAAKIGMWKSLVAFYISSGYDYWREYGHEVYLFSMDEGLEEDLNNGVLLKKLKKNFETKDILLPDNIVLNKENETKWAIIDKENDFIFLISKKDGKFHFYKKDIWMLEQAIDTTEHGYKNYACQLENERDKKDLDSEFLICKIKNNLAYYYAEREKIGAAESGDKSQAQQFIKYVYERMDKYLEKKNHWSDDRDFVIDQFHLK
jgi:hypothetical protein